MPKQHLTFDDDDKPKEGGIPGPLSIDRLEKLEKNVEQLSDGDLRFHSSEDEKPKKAQKTSNNKAHGVKVNGNGNGNHNPKNVKRGKVVNFYSDDEEDEPKKLDKHALKQRRIALQKDRQTLPICISKDEVMQHVLNNKVTVLLGETGSGKSTQLPQLIWEANRDEKIAITQPRRVAAINLAGRVAEETGNVVGSKVGYSVRFQNKSGPNTRIKYLTDGMLMRELILDPELSNYTTIILDEAHERTVLTDLLMGIMKRLMQKRDIRLVVMSATLDADRFAKFFGAPVVFVEGKTFPVERFYLREPLNDAVDGVIQCCCQLNMSEPNGDILVFLAGQEEIDKCVDRLNSLSPQLPKQAPQMVALPLYASLAPAVQQQAFGKLEPHQRKVILATNIAETSLTIPGVKFVVDTGLRKVRMWKPELGLDTLLTTAISQASAAQRMGRAGREQAGKCFRLYTESTYQDLVQQTEPEILRCDIASTILMLKRAGIDDILGFDWVERPKLGAIESALLKLYSLQALDNQGKITQLGEQMALLPVAPQLAAVLINASSESTNLLNQIIDIVSCISVEDLLVNPHPDVRDQVNEKRQALFPLAKQYGDLIMLKQLVDQYRGLKQQQLDRREKKEWCRSVGVNPKGMENVQLVRRQLCRYMGISDTPSTGGSVDAEDVIKTFLKGYMANTALGLPDRRYKTTTHQQYINIHPSSMIFGTKHEAIMYMEYVYTTKGYARCVAPIEIAWLEEAAPHLLARS